jgi:cell wall-associated NlpC family hydrolase
MTAVQRALRPAFFRIFLALAVVLSVGGAAELASAPNAEAAAMTSAKRAKVVKVAATRKGAAYRYGAMGPRRFDCSGLVKWSYARVGKSLPRTSSAQYRSTRHISRSARRPGDLVFFMSGSHVYHVGIYAGGNKLWDAPRPGKSVSKRTIWTSKVRYGRVR